MCQGPLLFRRDFSISLQGVEVALCEGFACGRTWGLKKKQTNCQGIRLQKPSCGNSHSFGEMIEAGM